MHKTCRAAFGDSIPDEVRAVGSNLGDLPVDAFVAEVEQIAPQSSHSSGNSEMRVRLQSLPRCRPAFPKTEHPVRIPIAMTNPPATVEGAAGKLIGHGGLSGVARNSRFDFGAQRSAHFFVSVESQQPWLGSFFAGGILLSDIPLPRFPINAS